MHKSDQKGGENATNPMSILLPIELPELFVHQHLFLPKTMNQETAPGDPMTQVVHKHHHEASKRMTERVVRWCEDTILVDGQSLTILFPEME